MLQTITTMRSPNATQANARERIRVMLIDDSLILLGDAVAFLQGYPEVEVVGKACSAKNALAQVELCAPNLVLLDVTCQGASGLGIIAELHAFDPALPVIVVDMVGVESVQRAARAVGASAYITKTTATTCLLPAILAVFHGDTFQI